MMSLITELEGDPTPNNDIKKSVVVGSMRSNDIEELGALYVLITEPKHYKRIKPSLNYQDYDDFLKNYLRRCIFENPNGEWSDSSYTAAWDFVNWFQSWWNDEAISPLILESWKTWLADIYKSGDERVRECVATGMLEHLLENAGIRDFFSDWKNDNLLSSALL